MLRGTGNHVKHLCTVCAQRFAQCTFPCPLSLSLSLSFSYLSVVVWGTGARAFWYFCATFDLSQLNSICVVFGMFYIVHTTEARFICMN